MSGMGLPASQPECGPFRLGVVSFLNSKPLIEGLADDPRVVLRFAVPSALPVMLRENEVDAALIPAIDLPARPADGSASRMRASGRTGARLPYGCSPSSARAYGGAVRRPRLAHVGGTCSDNLENVYHRPLRIEPLAATSQLRECESVLLIGDKVVTTPMPGSTTMSTWATPEEVDGATVRIRRLGN